MALWTPAEIATALWLDASDSSTITIATGISNWADKSGNLNDAQQGTGSAQPTVNSGGLNSLDTISFNGTSQFLALPTGFLYNAIAFSLFIVLKCGVQSNAGHFGPNTSNNAGIELLDNTIVSKPTLVRINGSEKYSTGAWRTDSSFSISSIVANSSAVSGFLDGTALTPASGISALNYNGYYAIGKYSTTYFSSLEVAEFIIITSDLSSENRQLIEGYLAWKWGLQDNLPANHLYKAYAPTIYTSTGGIILSGTSLYNIIRDITLNSYGGIILSGNSILEADWIRFVLDNVKITQQDSIYSVTQKASKFIATLL